MWQAASLRKPRLLPSLPFHPMSLNICHHTGNGRCSVLGDCSSLSCSWCRVLEDNSRVEEAVPTLAGEDFSFYSHTAGVPACFTFLGIRDESLGSVHGLHTPKFKLDEAVLKLGAALHAGLATEFLDTYQDGLPGSSKDEL